MSKDRTAVMAPATILAASHDASLVARLRALADAGLVAAPSAELGERDVELPGDAAVIVMHDRLWARTPLTARSDAALRARVANDGAEGILLLRTDDSPLPAWAADAESATLDGDGLAAAVAWLRARVHGDGAVGGRSNGTATATTDDVNGDEELAATGPREGYLGASRSSPACARELTRLFEAVVREAKRAAEAHPTLAVDAQRSLNRALVQLGPVALSLSWVRGAQDVAADGQLLVLEWRGRPVRDNGFRSERPGQGGSAGREPAPRVLREEVFHAEATCEADWRWTPETRSGCGFTADELAVRQLASLLAAAEDAA